MKSFPEETCALCGTGRAIVIRETYTFSVRGRSYNLRADECYRCTDCGETYYDGWQGKRHSERVLALRRQSEGLLAPDEIRALRRRYALTQKQLEKILGLGTKTVVRWERGTVLQSRAADDVLRLLARCRANMELLARHRGVRLGNSRERPSVNGGVRSKRAA